MREVQILQQSAGAAQARGLTVIIDVFRAFTTSCQLISNGAVRIIPVASRLKAAEIAKSNIEFILIGERRGVKLPEAAYGNSPSEIAKEDFSGKTIVLTTSAGTHGFSSAQYADQLISGSLANADAIVEYIRMEDPERVSLVCMGLRDERPTEEDTLCAEYIRSSLSGKKLTQAFVDKKLKNSIEARKFFDPTVTWAPEEDYYVCTKLAGFPFILKLEQCKDGFHALLRKNLI